MTRAGSPRGRLGVFAVAVVAVLASAWALFLGVRGPSLRSIWMSVGLACFGAVAAVLSLLLPGPRRGGPDPSAPE